MSDISHRRCEGCGEPEYACICSTLVKYMRCELHKLVDYLAACRKDNSWAYLGDVCRRLNSASKLLGDFDTFYADGRYGSIARKKSRPRSSKTKHKKKDRTTR